MTKTTTSWPAEVLDGEVYSRDDDGRMVKGIRVPLEKFFDEELICSFKDVIKGVTQALDVEGKGRREVESIVFESEVFDDEQRIYAAVHLTNERHISSYRPASKPSLMFTDLVEEITEHEALWHMGFEPAALSIAYAAMRLGTLVRSSTKILFCHSVKFTVKDGTIEVYGSIDGYWFRQEI